MGCKVYVIWKLIIDDFSQHGESDHNLRGLIGGDSDLSPRGTQYAAKLADFIEQQQIEGLRVWTSRMKRAIQTVADVPAPQERWKALNEIDAVSILFFYSYVCFVSLNVILFPV